MAEDRLKIWETLFRRALELIDSVTKAGISLDDWSFGGGTVLMLKHRHRFSKDIDIFVPDSQYLAYLTPRLNDVAESMTGDYVEQGNFLKLQFKEGEIDFVASAPLTKNPTTMQRLLDRDVRVETSTEIVAKKVWHRGDSFKARDILDLSMVVELEPNAMIPMQPILRDRRGAIFSRIAAMDSQLREDFDQLDVLEYTRSYDECIDIVTRALNDA
jgi:hypothetical protein